MLAFVVYYLTSPGDTPYDYFTRLSTSLLQGKLFLIQNPPWLNELVPVNGVFYVVYPPMPAILAMPAALIFGSNLSQTLFSIFIGSINVVLVYLLGIKLQFGQKTSILLSLFFGFGTNHWYLAGIGSAWYIAHIVALFFLLLALLETFGKGRLFLIGLLLGASFWSRTTVIMTAGFFFLYFWRMFWPINDSKKLFNFISLCAGIGVFIGLDALYNYVRFSSWSVLSPYKMIPGIKDDPIFQQGFMSVSYIPRQLEAAFKRLPTLSNEWPYLIPSTYSLAIWFTSPWILLLIWAKRNFLTICCWAAIVPTFFVVLLWGGVGFTQFGYRFAQDFMPFLLILLGSAIGKKPSWYVYALLILSILINAWGVILINKFSISTL